MRLFDRLVSLSLPVVPRFAVGIVARPYIAGETVEDAFETVAGLHEMGARATLDLLGEEIDDVDRARAYADRYLGMLEEIGERDIPTGVSIKLTGMAVRKDPTLAGELTRKIVARARDVGRFVRIDMEDSSLTSRTLGIYRRLRREGFDNTGVVLQSCLRRTFDDARQLAEMKADVRLVKGIYVEAEAISYRHPEAIRRNYARVLRLLLERGCCVAAATHDDLLLYETEAAMGDLGLKPGDVEIQMLLGVRVPLLRTLIDAGHRLRVYVPFGEEWYAYGVRRLKENPAIAGHVTKAFVGRVFGRGR